MSDRRWPWILAAVVLGIVLTASQAFAFSLLWGWFVVPLGAPPIGALHAYGLSLMISLLREHEIAEEEDDPDRYIKAASRHLSWIVGTCVCVCLGAITACVAGLP